MFSGSFAASWPSGAVATTLSKLDEIRIVGEVVERVADCRRQGHRPVHRLAHLLAGDCDYRLGTTDSDSNDRTDHQSLRHHILLLPDLRLRPAKLSQAPKGRRGSLDVDMLELRMRQQKVTD